MSRLQPDHNGRALLPRKTLYRIHAAKKWFRWDDDEYRDVLESVCGVRSAADIRPEQVLDLQRHFRSKGWTGYLLSRNELPPLPYADCDNRVGRPTGRQLRLLEVTLREIPGFGDTDFHAAARAWCESVCGVSDPRLLDRRTYNRVMQATRRLADERRREKRKR